MKKQGMLLVLCLVFAMVPTMAAAARTETDGSAIATQVAERKEFGGSDTADLALGSPDAVARYQGEAMSPKQADIAEGQRSADEVVTDWMGSPGHRANILMPELRYPGTGVSYDSNLHWVQLFITPENSDCQSISFDRELGYFTLKLQNGATAYAPYLMDFPPQEDEAVTFAYPGVSSIEGGAGKPAGQTAKKGHPFTDVKAGSYYEDAVVWALKNKVTSGTTATTFSPRCHLYPWRGGNLPVALQGQPQQNRAAIMPMP